MRMTPEELAAKNARNKAAWNRAGVTHAEVAKVTKGKVGKFKEIHPAKPTKAETLAKIKLPTEHQEQASVIEWCDRHPIAKRIFAIPNGANKSFASAAKFKREGLRKGIPDLCLPVASRGFHGLFIEMKRKRLSNVSPEQAEWAEYLCSAGYFTKTCCGAQEAIETIEWYLSGL